MYSGNKEQRMRGPFRLTVMVLEIIKQLELSYLAVNQPSRQTQIIQTQGVSRPTNPSECQTLLLSGAFHLKLFQLMFISLLYGMGQGFVGLNVEIDVHGLSHIVTRNSLFDIIRTFQCKPPCEYRIVASSNTHY